MVYEDIYDNDKGSDNTGDTDIDPRDSYSSRFQVISRDSSARRPRPAIVSGNNRMKSSDRVFSNKYDNSTYGGNVNMKNVTPKKHSSKRINVNTDLVEPENEIDNTVYDKITENTSNTPQTNTAQAQQPSEFRSSGLDSLFSSTTDAASSSRIDPNQPVSKIKNQTKRNTSTINVPSIDEDDKKATSVTAPDESGRIKVKVDNMPNEVLSSPAKENFFKDRPASDGPTLNRKLTVLKPTSYSCVEQISIALKNREVLVLCLKFANGDESRRILDFAFGAASITGAQVSLGAEKTYIFTIGPGLTQDEKLQCINEGVALKEEQ